MEDQRSLSPDNTRKVHNTLCEIAMRIQERKAAADLDILGDKRLEQRGFSSAGLADQVAVRKPIAHLHSDGLALISSVGGCEARDI